MRGILPDGSSYELYPGSPSFGEERICIREPQGEQQVFPLHDYARVYRVPGLYEAVVQDALDCRSPRETAARAAAAVASLGLEPAGMRVLDVGAGNGVVGSHLSDRGFTRIFGTDLLSEAARAAARDRPNVYRHYQPGDLADPSSPVHAAIADWEPNLLTCASALGGGHMPSVALLRAVDALAPPALAVLTVAETRLEETGREGLGALLAAGVADRSLEELGRKRFRHRLSMAGEPIYYFAVTLRARR